MVLFQQKENNKYIDIERGTSFTIPVILSDEDGKPIVSSKFQIYFTLKNNKFDFDYDDDRALIKKDAVLGDRETGRYDINLSSKDTWLPPGVYYFDIMLKKDDDIYRLYSAETSITEAPSNRYQTDKTGGGLFGQPISIGTYKLKPIKVQMSGTFLLNYKDIPLRASPSFLLKKNDQEKVREIQHFTSRMRFPLVFKYTGTERETLIIKKEAPFPFESENPLGKIRISLEKDQLSIWSIPLRAEIKFYGKNEVKSLGVGEWIQIPLQENFIFHIKFENHLLIISGTRYQNEAPLMIEWFDFEK